jgi:hypothetical protein
MKNRQLQQGSPAHRVLCRLVDLGGTAAISRLIDVLSPEYQRVAKIRDRVIEPLRERGYVIEQAGAILKATHDGKEYAGAFLGRSFSQMETFEGKPAGPRVAKPFRPLDVTKLAAGRPIRDGAFEYASIPSMMGGARVYPKGSGN